MATHHFDQQVNLSSHQVGLVYPPSSSTRANLPSTHMGQSPSYPGPPPPAPLSAMAAYFLPAPSHLLTHDHPCPASTAASIEAALTTRLPPDIVQRILDLAGVWAVCRRTNRRPLVVQAGGAEPHGLRGTDWRTGQEEEMAQLKGRGRGMVDGPGNVWYLVSAPVGCTSEAQGSGREREDWEATDGPAILGADRAAWLAASRKERLTFGGGGSGGISEAEDGEEEEADDGEGRREAREDGDAQSSSEGRQKWWLRRVVLETYSRDQGWTIGNDHYGAPHRTLISSIADGRYLRMVVLVVRAQSSARRQGGAGIKASRAVQCCL